jgi:hypothetical protein
VPNSIGEPRPAENRRLLATPNPGTSLQEDQGDDQVQPYSSQCLHRLHQDMAILLQDYDEMIKPLENEEIKAFLVGLLQNVVGLMDAVEEVHDDHHGDTPYRLGDARSRYQDQDGEGDEYEYGEDDEGEALNDDGTPEDASGKRGTSEDPNLPTEEESVRGMRRPRQKDLLTDDEDTGPGEEGDENLADEHSVNQGGLGDVHTKTEPAWKVSQGKYNPDIWHVHRSHIQPGEGEAGDTYTHGPSSTAVNEAHAHAQQLNEEHQKKLEVSRRHGGKSLDDVGELVQVAIQANKEMSSQMVNLNNGLIGVAQTKGLI